ncbi:MAG TPA: metallophosphoesterase [Actinomycetota bacterium]|nr:metallophosphoesterase [Actinomycetota bacterium]
MRLLRRKGKAGGEPTRIFYACDIHGSEPTYRKFLNAARFYEVDALVFGGDLMGKLLIPIVRDAGGTWRASLQGRQHHLETPEQLREFTRNLDTLGFYWKEMDPEEYRSYEGNQERIDELFDELAKRRLREWVALAEERLAGTHVKVYLCGGNDDTEVVLSALDEERFERVVNCEERVVPIDDEHVLVTVGYSTPTPWDTPRERSDEEIGKVIEELMREVPDPSRAVCNFHCPPLDSGLDTCMKLDASVWPPAPVIEGGQPVYYGAGSESVRRALEQYQPTVGLHGHIHESRGVARYGRTPAFNPGSEYGEGVLRGLIVAIRGGEVVGSQFTSG